MDRDILNQRSKNKEEKRSRIVAAAKDIIASEGIEYLTMRHLAHVAKVSSRTPYNLFDSKTDILFEIILESMAPLAKLSAHDNGGLAVASLLEHLQRLLALDGERQEFYRNVHWTIMRSDDMESKLAGRNTLNRLIRDQLEQVKRKRELKPDTDVESLTVHLGILLTSILGMWADSQLTLKEALAHTRHAWTNSLLPAARGKALQYLREAE